MDFEYLFDTIERGDFPDEFKKAYDIGMDVNLTSTTYRNVHPFNVFYGQQQLNLLQYSCYLSRKNTVDVLLTLGAKINPPQGREHPINMLINKFTHDVIDIIKLFLDKGLDVNYECLPDHNILFYFFEQHQGIMKNLFYIEEQIYFINLLITRGINIKYRTKHNGENILHVYISNNGRVWNEICELFVDYEVDPYEKNVYQKTCLDMLIHDSYQERAENYILFRNGNIKPAKRD